MPFSLENDRVTSGHGNPMGLDRTAGAKAASRLAKRFAFLPTANVPVPIYFPGAPFLAAASLTLLAAVPLVFGFTVTAKKSQDA